MEESKMADKIRPGSDNAICRWLNWLLVMATVTVAAHAPARSATFAAVVPVVACDALKGAVVQAGTDPARIESAAVVSANVPTPYCEVKGYVAPQVRFELRLPMTAWRQRLLFNGCGGFCGAVRIAVPATAGCVPLSNGEFAQVSTDLGHSAAISDAVWAHENPALMRDFGNRAVHVVALASRAIVARFYGQPPRHAYFSGCSDGGREGMMAVQRYPHDFDGVIVGAPVLNETANNTIYHAWIVQHLLARDGTPLFPDDTLAMVTAAVVKRCGDASGVVADPTRCGFMPRELLCATPTSSADCLTPRQVALLDALYAGPIAPDGKRLYFGLPLGSEYGWNGQAKGSLEFASNFIGFATGAATKGPLDIWSVGYSPAALTRYNHFAPEVNATSPDLAAFRKAGGKLIIWHGWTDSGVPPGSSTAYVTQVRARLDHTDDFLRLYMLPGVNHCGGGKGPDRMDLLSQMMAWVEDGLAPGAVRAFKATEPAMERSIAPYPNL
jgi:hypothetical protein